MKKYLKIFGHNAKPMDAIKNLHFQIAHKQ